MSRLVYDKITMVAPSQVANFGGLFDRAGKLCCRPPLGPHDAEGGPGNWMQIKRLPGRKGVIDVDIQLRRCDNDGFWEQPTTFTALLDEIKRHPEKDVLRLLTQATCQKISEYTGRVINDGFHIHVIIHTPNGQTGLGLGGSASSAAIVVGIDAMFGAPLAELPYGDTLLLRLAAEGERIASGRLFFDNVAPLIIKGDMVYISPSEEDSETLPEFTTFDCPSNLHMVTITPDFAISTSEMTRILTDKAVSWRTAEAAGDHKMEFMRGLLLRDIHLMIRHATNIVTEPIRGQVVRGFSTAQQVVREMNDHFEPDAPRFSLGISGSGPTMYALACSLEEANQIGYQIFQALRERDNIYSWWFCHSTNPHGAEIIGREISAYGV